MTAIEPMILHTAKLLRKFQSLAIASVALAVLLSSGCGSRSAQRSELRFWAIGSEVEKIRDLLAEFERQNPDVLLRVQQIPWSAAHEKLLTAFAGDATPDVCQLGNTWIPEFAALGALAPLDERIAGSEVVKPADYFPGLWETNQVAGQTYGIPWYADTRVLFYRKDMLAEAGWPEPPETWDEWLAAMRDVKRNVNPETYAVISMEANGNRAAIIKHRVSPERYAILMPINEWEHLTILGLQTGADMLRDDGRYANFDSPEFRRALAFYARLFDEGLAPPVMNTQISNYWEEFGRGYFAMYVTGPWNLAEFRRRLPPDMQDDWATAPLPRPAGSEASVSQAGGSGLVVFRRSQHKDAAWRLVEFLSRPENLVEFYEQTGNLPPRESAWQLGALEEDPRVRAFHTQLEHARPLPRVPEWEQITTKIMQAGQAVVAERKTADEAIRDLDRSVDAMLEKRRWMLTRQDD
jgi:multiple sugar transport system substrate-binding protein